MNYVNNYRNIQETGEEGHVRGAEAMETIRQAPNLRSLNRTIGMQRTIGMFNSKGNNKEFPLNSIKSVNSLNVMKLHQELGNKWTRIAKLMGASNEITVKNCFYSFVRRVIRKIKNNSIILHEKEDEVAHEQIKYILDYLKPFLQDRGDLFLGAKSGPSAKQFKNIKFKKLKENYISKIIRDSGLSLYDVLRFEVTLACSKPGILKEERVFGGKDKLLGVLVENKVENTFSTPGTTLGEAELKIVLPHESDEELSLLAEQTPSTGYMSLAYRVQSPTYKFSTKDIPWKESMNRELVDHNQNEAHSLIHIQKEGDDIFSFCRPKDIESTRKSDGETRQKWDETERAKRYRYIEGRANILSLSQMSPKLPLEPSPIPVVQSPMRVNVSRGYYPFGIDPQAAQVINAMNVLRNYGIYLYPPYTMDPYPLQHY